MSTLCAPMIDHLKCIEGLAHSAMNALEADSAGAAFGYLEMIVASLREAQASLAHDAEIAETRASLERGDATWK